MVPSRFYLSVLRWLLLLLVALVFEKCLDALTVKVSADHSSFFRETVVCLPFDGVCMSFHQTYINGVLQVLVISMFLFRYLLLIVEPITEKCRTEGSIDFNKSCWKTLLDQVGFVRILFAIVVTLCESLFILQAAVALPNVEQWLIFLAMLIMVDIASFLVLPFVINLVLLVLIGIASIAHAFNEGWTAFWCALKSIFTNETVENTTNSQARDKLRNYLKSVREARKEWVKYYLLPDFLDLLVAIGGLLIVHYGNSENVAIIAVFLFTVGVTVWSCTSNRSVYRDNIGVLMQA